MKLRFIVIFCAFSAFYAGSLIGQELAPQPISKETKKAEITPDLTPKEKAKIEELAAAVKERRRLLIQRFVALKKFTISSAQGLGLIWLSWCLYKSFNVLKINIRDLQIDQRSIVGEEKRQAFTIRRNSQKTALCLMAGASVALTYTIVKLFNRFKDDFKKNYLQKKEVPKTEEKPAQPVTPAPAPAKTVAEIAPKVAVVTSPTMPAPKIDLGSFFKKAGR